MRSCYEPTFVAGGICVLIYQRRREWSRDERLGLCTTKIVAILHPPLIYHAYMILFSG